eukprot:CAMPEP_0117756972 /NCGR_PEP_ID=MMETSP0947-20121206/14431_1 /TAXON_ID=44440 /ORGANISM="Chattonella subsalsa, Strain CCMP2191" /LENGTH=330 /DNA_ID=CAMNT_0005576731 /DNA_START=28 /DNA_END=1020 /DNA_ORIENTATION=+
MIFLSQFQPITCLFIPTNDCRIVGLCKIDGQNLEIPLNLKMSISNDDYSAASRSVSRRDFVASSLLFGGTATQLPKGVYAADEDQATAPETLKFRLGMKEIGPSVKVMQAEDVYYPEWFAGLWDSYSTTRDIEAPMGIELFGGNRTWEIAQKDLGNELVYLSRFRYLPDGRVIADRAFNIESITSSAMGKNSVLEVPFQDDPNDVKFTISPAGANGNVFKASLKTMGRIIESGPDKVTGNPSFSVSETVRQVVSSTTDLRFDPLVKDIETITIYSLKSENEIRALQRTATYIVPVDPVQRIKYEKSRGNAVDVRCYSVIYKIRKRFSSPK